VDVERATDARRNGRSLAIGACGRGRMRGSQGNTRRDGGGGGRTQQLRDTTTRYGPTELEYLLLDGRIFALDLIFFFFLRENLESDVRW
jgi:hypothetical protein